MMQLVLGFAFSLLISLMAYTKKSLNKSGAFGAVVLGSLIYFWGGIWFFIIMLLFFLSSSLISKLKKHLKENNVDIEAKGSNRDIVQVFANGGVALIFAYLYFIYKNPLFMLAFAAAFAESNADTWASEIGVLSRKNPISILNGKPIEKGMSGGISSLGTFASLMGAMFIAVIFSVGYLAMYRTTENLFFYFILCTAVGFIGAIIDSVLGALIQASYYCKALDKYTEKKYHQGKKNQLVKGFGFFNNDVVNFSSNVLTVFVVIALYLYL